MGLQGAPGTFQEAVNEILAEEIKEGFVKVYMDDVSVYSEDEDSHLIHVGRVVDKLKAHALKVKKSKCEIAKFEIKFLGHIVSQDSIKLDPERVSVLKSKEIPQTLVKSVKKVMAQYLHKSALTASNQLQSTASP